MDAENAGESNREVSIRMTFTHCHLPPVHDALVLGRRAPVGSTAVVRAMQAMTPGQYRLIKVDHPLIESLLVRETDLRKMPEETLVKIILDEAEPLMDETDALNVEIDLKVTVQARMEQ